MPKAWLHLLNAVLKFHFEVVPRESQHALVSDGIDNVTVTELETRPGSWWRQVTRQPPPQGPWSAEQPAQPRGVGARGRRNPPHSLSPAWLRPGKYCPFGLGEARALAGPTPPLRPKTGQIWSPGKQLCFRSPTLPCLTLPLVLATIPPVQRSAELRKGLGWLWVCAGD